MLLEFTIPGLRLKTGLNNREHFMARSTRVEKERLLTRVFWAHAIGAGVTLVPPFVITITRVSKGRCDDDNVAGSCKSVRDQVAQCLGINDGNRDVASWLYDQEKGRPAVRVKVQDRARATTTITAVDS